MPGRKGTTVDQRPSCKCIICRGDFSQFVKSPASLTERAEGDLRVNSICLDDPVGEGFVFPGPWLVGFFGEPFLEAVGRLAGLCSLSAATAARDSTLPGFNNVISFSGFTMNSAKGRLPIEGADC